MAKLLLLLSNKYIEMSELKFYGYRKTGLSKGNKEMVSLLC